VGIGTNNPAGILDVEGGTASGSGGGNIILAAQNGGTGSNAGGSIILTPGSSTGTATSGFVRVTNLAGTGFRPVYADGSGNLYTISGSGSNRQAFSYTGGAQTWNVPSGVNMVFVKLWGGGGLIGAAGGAGVYQNCGLGGSQTSGGAPTNGTCAGYGALYTGGNGCNSSYAGGGGGGYYGGGGGGNGSGNDGPGGGGSSYISGLIPYLPIRNEQGATNSENTYTPPTQPPGGTDGTDYTSGIGAGGGTVTSGNVGNAGGNGQVVIYW
jgi:hypothetical protein